MGYDLSNFEIKVLVVKSELAGQVGSGCRLLNNQLNKLSMFLQKVYDLINVEKGKSIKLLHIVRRVKVFINRFDAYTFYKD
jgi:hypothetical protein